MSDNLPPEARPRDPNGRLIRAKDFPAEGWEWNPTPDFDRDVWNRMKPSLSEALIEVRPIPEPIVMVELTVTDARAAAAWSKSHVQPFDRIQSACREALQREGLT